MKGQKKFLRKSSKNISEYKLSDFIMAKIKTVIFKNKAAFLTRKNKRINGVSEKNAALFPGYEKDNISNVGCWNCFFSSNCKYSSNLFDCENCIKCSYLHHKKDRCLEHPTCDENESFNPRAT